ncbi:zona pellucida sperm-binding protein 3-like [Acanthochromis polyacanthus]|uniref:zona pellucida sperm-binding protein 3-like n=1 Tax=Acanthochromis polyacanthus TaxID=80966 RepID=UPI002234D89F|nr:zona pellucida sperm-binding protein 3-like [Acanthochromis polyacanthus]
MDRQRIAPRWIIFYVFCSVFTLTDSRVVYNLQSTNSFGISGVTRPQLTALKQQPSAQVSARRRSVEVRCHPDSMEVVVQADMFYIGLRVDGGHLRLGSDPLSGGSECRAVQSGEAEFTIQAQLSDCGTELSSTEEKIIYSNVLVYSPEPSTDGLLRLDGATVPVECHYEKKYSVDGMSVHPTWVPFVSMTAAEDQIDFSLLLMTDDWRFERGSHIYFLGDPIHLEVSAILGNHMPLRVFVDHCVATATPDAEATLRYDFIENHGCLADAYLTNSNSRFLPRVEEHKLRFQLDAFRFYQEPSNEVYITCYVKAVPVKLAVSSQNRACSLIDNRWRSIDGKDEACRNCDLSYRNEEPPSTQPPKTTRSTRARPTTTSQEHLVQKRAEHGPATYIHFRPGTFQSRHSRPKLMKRGADHETEQIVQLGPLIVLPSGKPVTTEASKMLLSPKNNRS